MHDDTEHFSLTLILPGCSLTLAPPLLSGLQLHQQLHKSLSAVLDVALDPKCSGYHAALRFVNELLGKTVTYEIHTPECAYYGEHLGIVQQFQDKLGDALANLGETSGEAITDIVRWIVFDSVKNKQIDASK